MGQQRLLLQECSHTRTRILDVDAALWEEQNAQCPLRLEQREALSQHLKG